MRRDGYVWREDSTRTIENCIPTTLAAKYCYRAAEASATNNMALAKLFEDRTKKLRDRQRIINVLKLAETQIDFACTGNEFDQLSGCLPCLNGIYQFDDGTFREGQPKDYVRTFIPHNWTGIDTCAPLFIKFIEQVFPDVALRDFVQRLFGYSILGTGAERILPIFWGIGANGKSTLIEIIRYVLGDFAATTPAETLLATQSHSDGAPQPFLFRLRGKRFVATSETEETRRLNASLVKSLTGMDTLCVRTLHGKPIEFTPRFLTLLSTNHRPRVNADDQAVWDRLLLVPFNARFVDTPQGENEHARIPNIIEQFKAEASGILSWLVKGAHIYKEDGLRAPEIVRMATSHRCASDDTLQRFLDAFTTIGASTHKTRASDLYEAYKRWAEGNGYGVMSNRTFGERLIQKHIRRVRDANGNYYTGLIVNSPVVTVAAADVEV
ncbi:MAG: phage/plasmid primase, P4 family [bacterium]|nr:phage/plasmid primase, P4 family [bacterium]